MTIRNAMLVLAGLTAMSVASSAKADDWGFALSYNSGGDYGYYAPAPAAVVYETYAPRYYCPPPPVVVYSRPVCYRPYATPYYGGYSAPRYYGGGYRGGAGYGGGFYYRGGDGGHHRSYGGAVRVNGGGRGYGGGGYYRGR